MKKQSFTIFSVKKRIGSFVKKESGARQNIIMYFVASILLVLFAFSTVLVTDAGSFGVNSAEYPLLNFRIVLDAGHGGDDGGAIGIKTAVKEAEVNLSITLKLKTLFESAGAQVILTRKDDDDLCVGKYSKKEDMAERARIIEATDPYLVISVHCNSFPGKSVTGAQMFYCPGSESGKRIADIIQKNIAEQIDENNKRVSKCENFYMLRHGRSTNIMIECGFLSAPEEEKKLIDSAYQDLLAYAVFSGTCEYVNTMR